MSFEMPRSLYTVQQFLNEVPIGRTLLYDQIRQGRIRTVKIGSRTLIPSSEVARLLESASAQHATV